MSENRIKVLPRLEYMPGRENVDRPEGVKEYEAMIDGAPRTWKEYVPSSYDGSAPVPLVFSLHGGSTRRGGNFHTAELSTAWAHVAERENFIVVYPQSLTPEHTWSAWEDFENDKEWTKDLKDDIRYLDLLVEQITEKYNIDQTRMYLHAQSFGDVMATFYLLNHPGHPFAAAATLSGPVGADRLLNADGTRRFGRACATPVVRTHGMNDPAMPFGRYQHLDDPVPTYDLWKEKKNTASKEELMAWKLELHMLPLIDTWKNINGCGEVPLLSIRGRYNACTWKGEYDFHFYTVEGGGHGPSLDMADFIWEYYFTGWKKIDGKSVPTDAPAAVFRPDDHMLVLAAGASKAFRNQKLMELPDPVCEKDGVLYLTVPAAQAVFPELCFTTEDEGLSVVIREKNPDSLKEESEEFLQMSANNRTYVRNNHLRHGDRTVYDPEQQKLLLPAAQIAENFFGYRRNSGFDVLYLTDHSGAITYDFSRLVKMYLGTDHFPTTKEMAGQVAKVLEGKPQPGM